MVGLLYLAILVVTLVALWKVFEKANKPGWAGIIPIYNIVVLLEIIGKPLWWIVLFFIPFVNFVAAFLVAMGVAERFGKPMGFAVGLFFLPFVFYPMLAFTDATYTPPPART